VARKKGFSAGRLQMHKDFESQFARGIAQFNARLFFEAHETWEEIWLPAPEPEKTFLQGLIQVAAAFHHYGRKNRAGAKSLLAAGLAKLEAFPEDHHGLELEALRIAGRQWKKAFHVGADPGPDKLPQIERRRNSRGRR
jgi:predicted metal-dependent hydrolase